MKTVHLSKRVNIFIFLSLLFLSIASRYPVTPHEIGADSFYIHELGESITKRGYAMWILHPLAYFGLYPQSYPAAVPFLISAAQQLTGLPMEYVIYLAGQIFGIIALMGAYLLAGEFWNDDRFKFLSAAAFSLSPIIIKFTCWTISTRGLFLTLTPLMLGLILKTRNLEGSEKVAYLIVGVFFLITLALIHRMFGLIVITILIFYILMWIFKLSIRRFNYNSIYRTTGKIGIITMSTIIIIFASIILFISIENIYNATDIHISLAPSSVRASVFIGLIISLFLSVYLWFVSRDRRPLKQVTSTAIVFLGASLFFVQFTKFAPWQDFSWLRTILPGELPKETLLDFIVGLWIVMGARIGIFLIPAVVGMLILPFTSIAEPNRIFLVVALFLFFPFFHVAMYFYQVFSVVYFLLGVYTLLFAYRLLSGEKRTLRKTGRERQIDTHSNHNLHKVKRKSRLELSEERIDKMRKNVAIGFVVVILIASSAFTIYTVEYRLQNTGKYGFKNYMEEHEYTVGLYLKIYKNDAPIYPGARIGAIWGEEPHRAPEDVEVVRKEPPSLFDFYGWFVYFKQPVEQVYTSKYTPCPAYKFRTDPEGKIENMLENGLIIYYNGRDTVWYTFPKT